MVLSLISAAVYLFASALIGTRMLKLRSLSGPKPSVLPIRLLITVALLLHGAALFPVMFTTAGLNMAFFNALSLAGWFATLLFLLVQLRHPIEDLGLVVLPATVIADVLFAFAAGNQAPRLFAVDSPIQAHIVLSILAYSTFSIAAVQAILLRIQDQHLHNRSPGGLIRSLPPLQLMEDILFSMIWVGFALLTLGLLSGALFLNDIFAQHLVHKTAFSIFAWSVFAVLLWGRHQFGWRGRRVINWALIGFAALVLAYFGTKLILDFVLAR